jgi:WD40 repeat protein
MCGAAFSHDGKLLASTADLFSTFNIDGKLNFGLQVYDVSTGRLATSFKGVNSVTRVAFSRDNKRLACADHSQREVWIWDAASGQVTFTKNMPWVADLIFSPDDRRLAAVGGNGWVTVWNAHDGQEVLNFRGYTGDRVLAFSPDSQHLVSAGEDRAIKLWDADTGKEVHAFVGHDGPITSLAFSPDGLRLASASKDGTVKVWDATTTRSEILTLRGHSGPVYRVAFSSDGHRLVSADAHTVLVWDGTPLNGGKLQAVSPKP